MSGASNDTYTYGTQSIVFGIIALFSVVVAWALTSESDTGKILSYVIGFLFLTVSFILLLNVNSVIPVLAMYFSLFLGPLIAIDFQGRKPDLYYCDLVVISLVIAVLVRKPRVQESAIPRNVLFLMIAFLGSATISSIASFDFLRSIAAVPNYGIGFLAFWVTLKAVPPRESSLRMLVYGFACWTVLMFVHLVLLGSQSSGGFDGWLHNRGLIELPLGRSNVLAGFIACLLPANLSLFWLRKEKSWVVTRFVAVIAFVVGVLILFIVSSRGGFWGAAIGLLAFLLIMMRSTSVKGTLPKVAVIVILFMLLLSQTTLWEVLFGRLSQDRNSGVSSGTFLENQDPIRYQYMLTSVNAFVEKPILGWGFNQFGFILFGKQDTVHASPHNIILFLLLGGGLVGTLIYFLLFGKVMVQGSLLCSRSRSSFPKPIAIGIVSGIIGAFVFELMEASYGYTPWQVFVWACVGLFYVDQKRPNQNAANEDERKTRKPGKVAVGLNRVVLRRR